MVDENLIFKLKNKKRILEDEIKALECQLETVEKRLSHIVFDIKLFLALIIIPFFVVNFLDFLHTRRNLVLMIFGSIAYAIVLIVYCFSLPVTVYCLIKNILLYLKNKDNPDLIWAKPAVRRYVTQEAKNEAPSYLMEKKNVLWVLSRYYHYQEQCNQLIQQAQTENENSLSETPLSETPLSEIPLSETPLSEIPLSEIPLSEKNTEADQPDINLEAKIQTALTDMPLYERIKPANPFNSKMTRNATLITLLIIVFAVGISLLWAVIWTPDFSLKGILYQQLFPKQWGPT